MIGSLPRRRPRGRLHPATNTTPRSDTAARTLKNFRDARTDRADYVRASAVRGGGASPRASADRPDGSVRGWADRVAEGLAASTGSPSSTPTWRSAATKLGPIVDEQLAPALALEPTLLTFNGGGNDIHASAWTSASWAVPAVAAIPGLEVPTWSCSPDPIRPRTSRWATSCIAAASSCRRDHRDRRRVRHPCVDMWHDPEIRRPEYWVADRIHLNPAGHERVARRGADRARTPAGRDVHRPPGSAAHCPTTWSSTRNMSAWVPPPHPGPLVR